MNEQIFTKEKLFWRDGECFIGFFNDDETEIKNLRVLRLDNMSGELMSVDAGFGLVPKGAIWNAKDLSVLANSSGVSQEPIINKPTLGRKKNLIPFKKIQEAACK